MGKMVNTKPIRMWIDGTCFNIKRFEKFKKAKKNLVRQTQSESSCTSTLEHKFAITKSDNNISTSFQLPSIYYIRLRNFPDFCLKKLELETRTKISMPGGGDDGHIVISGDNEPDVVSARHEVQSVVGEIRERQAAQFISIPVHSEEVQKNFELFKVEILNGDPIHGLDESIFQSSLKLHLTIVVFALMDSFEKDEAIAALSACKTEVIEPLASSHGPYKIKVSGINCMNDNVAKANILYANAKIEHEGDDDLLQKIANAISEYFYEKGLIIQYKENVKLHVTLINIKYRRSSSQSTPKKSRWYFKKQPFNATSILEKYKDFYFGESVFDSIHLSHMSSQGEDGFYKPLAMITF
ncbi:hypothetical protein FQR65_LT02278 [Abscondita terminalis]|nr:hypothetical protein FQR65_LT02278 [Abscondita terminalis]